MVCANVRFCRGDCHYICQGWLRASGSLIAGLPQARETSVGAASSAAGISGRRAAGNASVAQDLNCEFGFRNDFGIFGNRRRYSLSVAPPAALQSASARVGLLAALLALAPAIGAVIRIGRDAARASVLPSADMLDEAKEIFMGQVVQKWQRDHRDRWLNRPRQCHAGFFASESHGRALLSGIKTPGLPGQVTIISQDGGWRLLQRR